MSGTPKQAALTMRAVMGLDIDDRIAEAGACGRRYTPTSDEWDRAHDYQRRQMTWPREIIEAIRRNP